MGCTICGGGVMPCFYSKGPWRVGFLVSVSTLLFLTLPGHSHTEEIREDFTHHFTLGVGYIDQHKYVEAVHELKMALKLRPDDLPTMINLGLAYHHQLKYDDAISTFTEILEINPDEPYSHYNLGFIYKVKGEFSEAKGEFRRVLEIDPYDPAAHYNLGAVYAQQDKFELAIDEFKKTIELAPDALPAYYALARALMMVGKTREAGENMAKYQQLRASGVFSSEAEKYFREGKYLDPVELLEKPSGQEETGTLEVQFIDVTAKSGLGVSHGRKGWPSKSEYERFLSLLGSGSPEAIQSSEYTSHFRRKIAMALGSGALFFDYDNDGDLDLYLVRSSESEDESANILYRNEGNGTFTDVTSIAGVGDRGMGIGCVAGDYDNDGYVDLYVTNYGANVLYRNNGDGTFSDVTSSAGVGDMGFGAGAAFADYDSDGDLDIYVANYVDLEEVPSSESLRFPEDFVGQPNVLYRNNGDGTFTDVTEEAGVDGGKGRSLSVVFFDFDNDRYIDIYVVNDRDANILYRNNRDGTFTDVAGPSGVADQRGGRGVAVGDYNKDGWLDLYVTNRQGEGNVLYRNRGDGSFEQDISSDGVLRPGGKGSSWGAAFIDFDNDNDLDLLVAVDPSPSAEGSSGLMSFRNTGDGTFSGVMLLSGLAEFPGLAVQAVLPADFDDDGDVDLLLTGSNGSAVMLRNEGGNRNNWLKIRLVGTKSNVSGIGAKVEIKSGKIWLRREVVGGSGFLAQPAIPVEFGLADKTTIDLVRVYWPRGIRQSFVNVSANQTLTIVETSAELASCPTVYSWNGSEFTFVSDILGNAVVGYLLGPGMYNPPDPDEYLKIEGYQLQPKDGLYTILFLEQLGEIAFLDQAKLLVIDHPSDVDVYPNERFQVFPPFPEFDIIVAKDARPPVWAVDDNGNDILPLLAERDRTYPEDFQLLSHQGFAEPHSIVLDLGDLSDAEGIWLIIYG
ncbi:MAG TPA: tetratricopeptide repeat protein [Candidatus Latescibacteria bacterium]|nr:tetratricopeptide repeat protein [Candidatus Latescibacterota bacterium]